MQQRAEAYRTVPSTAGTVLLCLAGLLTAGNTIHLATPTPIPTIWFMLPGVVVCSSLPLYPSLGLLERTLTRARLSRALRAGEATALVATSALVLGGVHHVQPVVIWFVLLAALSLLACVATVDTSRAVVLAIGTGSILIDHLVDGVPVSRAMDALGVWPALAAYLVAWLIFVVVPGRSGSS